MLGGLVQLGIDPAIDFSQAADLARAVRRTGHTVRSAMDCLIASVALRRNAILVRIGLEDVLVLPDGSPARDNLELVRAARELGACE